MTRPVPTRVYHFTHIDHLATVAEHGLLCDNLAREHGLLTHEAGEPRIKAARGDRAVRGGTGGTVGDYVPFYFATRSPMLFSIYSGNVPTYSDRLEQLVYLVTS